MKIKAAVLRQAPVERPYADTRPLAIESIELEPPGPQELLVKIEAAGLCHSDLSIINGDRPRPTPMVIGHEAVGTIEKLGDGVEGLAIGDRVVMAFLPTCGTCPPCSTGRTALCEPGAVANTEGTLLSGKRRLKSGDQFINHHSGVSAFAERAIVSEYSVVKIEPDIPPVEAALFGCAVLTGVGAVVNTCRVSPGESVAVIGLGGVGLSSVLGARVAGAARIVAIDLSDDKLELARQLGASHAFNARDDDIVEKVRRLTSGGVEHAIEMAGNAAAFQLAFDITRRGGVTASGGLANQGARVDLSPLRLVAEERTIKGSYMGGCSPRRDIPRFIKLYRSGLLPVAKLLSSTGPLEEINEAFDLLDQGKVVRHVITF